MNQTPKGSTPYETWVLTLRAWQEDHQVSLDGLPTLADDTFTPETYQRLVQHIHNAMDRVAKEWDDGAARAFSAQLSPFDLGRGLVSLRGLLARQWQLANHSSLPDGLRIPLSDGVRRQATATQQGLEDSVRRRIAGASHDRSSWEGVLRTLRENSLTRITEYTMGADGRMVIALDIPEPSLDQGLPATRSSRFAHRRLFTD